jgi:hypothetical protein
LRAHAEIARFFLITGSFLSASWPKQARRRKSKGGEHLG